MRGGGIGPNRPPGRPPGEGSGLFAPGPWMLHVGLGAMLLVGLGLHLRLGAGLMEALLAGFLLFTLPMLSVLQLSLMDAARFDRPGMYAGSAVTLVVLTVVALVVGALGSGLDAMALRTAPLDEVAIATGWLALGTVLLFLLFVGIQRVTAIEEHPLLAELIPRTPHERRLFAGLSVVAGLGEEIVFRGFLLAVLTPALGDPWTALLVSSLAFGVLHVYQGPFGIARTALLGALFGVSVILTGTLWPAVVVHVVYDWFGGLVYGPRSLPPSDDARRGRSLDEWV